LLYVRLEQIDLRALRVTIEQPVRLAELDRRQRAALDIGEQIDRVRASPRS
jgi:hypothetical protein